MSRLAAAVLSTLAGTACSLGALDGFSGGTPSADAGPTDAAPLDTGSSTDTAPPLMKGASCKAIKEANPNAPDGRYLIEPPGQAPFEADCDMTQDGGGWMRVTEAMLAEEKKQATTVFHDLDDKGRLVLRIYANSFGCGNGVLDDWYVAIIRDVPKWKDLRARYEFYGHSSCWNILGTKDPEDPFVANMIAFDPSIDVARDAVKMGGSKGDSFDGRPARCDNNADNFWNADKSVGRRSLLATLRRASQDIPAGLATTTSCTEVADGAASPTYWEYREIYVR